MQPIQQIADAIMSGDASSDDFANLAVPDHYTGALLRQEDETMFEGMPTRDRDPRKALRVEDVPVPELGPAKRSSPSWRPSINYNTVWSSIFEPVSTFAFLSRYGRTSPLAKRHDLPYHVLGSDLAGVVLRTGPGVHAWKPGDEVVAHCRPSSSRAHSVTTTRCSIPSNASGDSRPTSAGLAQLALVKANQLLEKPAHLTWEEAASPRTREQHRVPPAGQPQRCRHEAGRHRAHLGCQRRARLVRDADGAERRRNARVRRVVA